jgi:DNA-binding IclR family transcriptional regulator
MRAPSSSPDLPDQIPLVADALARIKGMFEEMPGTEWTVTDAARLSGLESSVCRAILDALRQAGFLTQRADGSYVRGRVFASAGSLADADRGRRRE